MSKTKIEELQNISREANLEQLNKRRQLIFKYLQNLDIDSMLAEAAKEGEYNLYIIFSGSPIKIDDKELEIQVDDLKFLYEDYKKYVSKNFNMNLIKTIYLDERTEKMHYSLSWKNSLDGCILY